MRCIGCVAYDFIDFGIFSVDFPCNTNTPNYWQVKHANWKRIPSAASDHPCSFCSCMKGSPWRGSRTGIPGELFVWPCFYSHASLDYGTRLNLFEAPPTENVKLLTCPYIYWLSVYRSPVHKTPDRVRSTGIEVVWYFEDGLGLGSWARMTCSERQ